MSWTVGQKLQDGQYTVEKILGEGGFGITYLVWSNLHARRFVIKTLNDAVRRDREFDKLEQDFLNEALRLAKCHHPHIVEVEEVIQEQGQWSIVMEYVAGETMRQRLRGEGILSEAEALLYIRQIGEALIAVHESGLLHRDVKPGNILLREGKPSAVLIDFGLARDFVPNLTQHHTSYGTDGYAPIEQYDSRQRRGSFIDVYGLAATLYTMLTGEIPVCAPVRVTGRLLDDPQQLNPRISDRVKEAIFKGMELRAEDRSQSVPDWLSILPLPTPEESQIFVPIQGITTDDLIDLDTFLKASTPEHQAGMDRDRVQAQKQAYRSTSYSAQRQPEVSLLGSNAAFKTGESGSHVSLTLPQTLNSRYGSLRDWLLAGEWEVANQLTTILMLRIAGREYEGNFSVESIQGFPCQDLVIINQLWHRCSQGQFGFSVQKQIFHSSQKKSVTLAAKVGWYRSGEWIAYSDLFFGLEAPAGHLPIGFLSGCSGGIKSGLMLLDRYVFARFDKCL